MWTKRECRKRAWGQSGDNSFNLQNISSIVAKSCPRIAPTHSPFAHTPPREAAADCGRLRRNRNRCFTKSGGCPTWHLPTPNVTEAIRLRQDAKLSAEHAVILCRRGRFEVHDQQSSTGTFLDGVLVPMQGGQLENYSELKAGATTWTFVKLQDSTSKSDRTTMDVPSNLVPHVQRLLDTFSTRSS